MSAPVFSIIIPVYNGRKYIERCLVSIMTQTFQNYEIIIIDDGSTDGTGTICRKYEGNNSGIRYIKKENGGVSSARNVGIREAAGKYLLFVDADDHVESNYLSSFYECSRKFDPQTLIVCGMNRNQDYHRGRYVSGLLTEEDCVTAIANDTVGGFAVNKLFCRDIVIESNLLFDEKISICEDLLFCMRYVPYIRNCYVMPEKLYNYDINPGSATKKDNLKLIDAINVLERVISYTFVRENRAAKHYFVSNQHHMCIRFLKAALDAGCFDEKAGELKISHSLLDFSGIVFNRDIRIRHRLYYLYLFSLCRVRGIRI